MTRLCRSFTLLMCAGTFQGVDAVCHFLSPVAAGLFLCAPVNAHSDLRKAAFKGGT